MRIDGLVLPAGQPPLQGLAFYHEAAWVGPASVICGQLQLVVQQLVYRVVQDRALRRITVAPDTCGCTLTDLSMLL